MCGEQEDLALVTGQLVGNKVRRKTGSLGQGPACAGLCSVAWSPALLGSRHQGHTEGPRESVSYEDRVRSRPSCMGCVWQAFLHTPQVALSIEELGKWGVTRRQTILVCVWGRAQGLSGLGSLSQVGSASGPSAGAGTTILWSG